MQSKFILTITVALGLSLGLLCVCIIQNDLKSQLSWDQDIIVDLGNVLLNHPDDVKKSAVKHTFSIVNPFNVNATLSSKNLSCGCVSNKFDTSPLLPGECRIIQTEVGSSYVRHKKSESVVFRLESELGEWVETKLTVAFEVFPRITFGNQDFVDLDPILKSDLNHKLIEVVSYNRTTDHPIELNVFADTDSLSQYLDVGEPEQTTIFKEIVRTRRVIRIDLVKLRTSKQKGSFNIVGSSGKHNLNLKVAISQISQFRLSPTQLFFNPTKSTASVKIEIPQAEEKTPLLDGKVDVDFDQDLLAVGVEVGSGNTLTLNVKALKNGLSVPRKTSILLSLTNNSKRDTIELPVFIY